MRGTPLHLYLYVILVICAALFIVTQVLNPLARQTRFFPLFRRRETRRERELRAQLADLSQQEVEERLREEIAKRNKKEE